MEKKRQHVHSPRILRLAEKLRNPRYRHTYVAAHIRQFLARQMREMRGAQSQGEFGDKIGKAQNVVSRLEDPTYGKWTLSTLLEIAEKLDRALVVRFVDYPTFLGFTDDQSETAAAPEAYEQKSVEEFAWQQSMKQSGKTPADEHLSINFAFASGGSMNFLALSPDQINSGFTKILTVTPSIN